MASTYPNSIQSFPTMEDLTASDLALVKQFQVAMQSGNIQQAQAILTLIPNYQNKIISTSLMNTAWDTLVALQEQFAKRYSPAYVVSETQPASQEIGDYWFKVIGTVD